MVANDKQPDTADHWFAVEWSQSQQYVNVATLTEVMLANADAWRENRQSDWLIVYASPDENAARQVAKSLQAICYERQDAAEQNKSAENN